MNYTIHPSGIVIVVPESEPTTIAAQDRRDATPRPSRVPTPVPAPEPKPRRGRPPRPPQDTVIGRRMQEIGMGQRELARRLGAGPMTVSQWVHDVCTPGPEYLGRVAEILRLDREQIVRNGR